MKLSLNWLKQYLETDASVDAIVEKLTAIGLEVEGVDDKAAKLNGFVVGHVVSATKHPDADKLQCLIVDTGVEKLNVVCGAPNARQGMKGVFAPVGSYIPGLDVTLKKGNIRGQESLGMMCSARELELSDEHAGVIELPESAVTGSPAAAALGVSDVIIDVNLTPNRGDCAGVYGVARDLAATGIGSLKPVDTTEVAGAFKNPVGVTIADETACPLFIGRYIRGVKNGPSPDWLQKALQAVGQKPISALVDITNYMTLGLNRPLHVFDADKLKGNIHVRLSKAGETLAALNDKTYTLDDGMVAVCDDSGVLGLGGIIGGVSSSVDENTVNVYLECAYFNPALIAKTGQKLQIDSDARYRFERGIDPAFSAAGAEVATRLITEICGGTASEVYVAGNAPDITRKIAYTPARLKQLGGSDLSDTRQKEILTALGFTLDGWNVTTPSWRHDVEGTADIVEEILRIDGYDNIPPVAVTLPAGQLPPVADLQQRRTALVRRTLASRGLCETVTWSFIDSDRADLFGAATAGNKAALTLVNPISEDLAVMRPSALPNLIDAAARNTDRGHLDAALFEIGGIYRSPEYDGQVTVATGLRTGHAVARHWSAPARAVDVFDAKADALAALEACGINTGSLQVTTDAPAWYHPGRSGVLRLGRAAVAYFGEFHPAVLAALGREDDAFAGFEVFFDAMPPLKKKGTRKDLLKLSSLQPVSRDFAFIVDRSVTSDTIVRAIKGVDRALITGVEIFDVYMGDKMEAGKKSVGAAVTIQPADKTLTDTEITALSTKVIAAVEKASGATLRA